MVPTIPLLMMRRMLKLSGCRRRQHATEVPAQGRHHSPLAMKSCRSVCPKHVRSAIGTDGGWSSTDDSGPRPRLRHPAAERTSLKQRGPRTNMNSGTTCPERTSPKQLVPRTSIHPVRSCPGFSQARERSRKRHTRSWCLCTAQVEQAASRLTASLLRKNINGRDRHAHSWCPDTAQVEHAVLTSVSVGPPTATPSKLPMAALISFSVDRPRRPQAHF